jgi:hypothetical protein
MMRRLRVSGLVLVPAGALVLSVVAPAVSAPAAPARARVIDAGTAAATANVLGITPGVSGLTLSATIGESNAAYQHAETQAKSGTLDLGSLGLVLATTTLCGRSELPSSAQPQSLFADSEDGKRRLTHGVGGLGTESVSVDPSPESASATTTTVDQTLPGLLTIRGDSHAQVRYVDGREQIATSSVIEDVSLLAGLVRIDGMRWTARRTSGLTSTRSTAFSFGQVELAGRPVAVPDSAPAATIDAINKVLAPFGLSVLEPALSGNHQTGSIAIGPLTVRFTGSAIDRAVLGPAVNGAVALEKLIREVGAPGDNCANVRELIDDLGNSADTLLNVGLAISQGAGALDVQLGGVAAAALDPAAYTSPFGIGDGATPPVDASGPPTSNSQESATGPPDTSSVVGSRPPAVQPMIAASATHCTSMSPSRAHGCWQGLATVAASGALGVGVALFIADLALTRRRRTKLRSAETSE